MNDVCVCVGGKCFNRASDTMRDISRQVSREEASLRKPRSANVFSSGES